MTAVSRILLLKRSLNVFIFASDFRIRRLEVVFYQKRHHSVELLQPIKLMPLSSKQNVFCPFELLSFDLHSSNLIEGLLCKCKMTKLMVFRVDWKHHCFLQIADYAT